MVTKEQFHRFLERAVGRLIVVHGDLFQNYLSLRLKLLLAETRSHQIGQQINRTRLAFGHNRCIKDGRVLRCVRVRLGTQVIEFSIDSFRRPLACPLKDHVLEEVADARYIRLFIARACLHEPTQ